MIALYFGSFNPLHNGHLAVAEYVVREGIASEVWLVVSPQNPHKPSAMLAPEDERLAMARMAVNGVHGVEVCDVEFGLPRPSYTIDTLDHLRRLYPTEQFALLGGGDVAESMHTWKEAERLMREHTILIYPRGENDRYGEPFVTLTGAPLMHHSSTEVRERIAAHDAAWRTMVPEVVAEWIEQKGLYMNEEQQSVERSLASGKEAYARNDFGEAINHFEAARRLNPECEEAAQWLEMIEDILAFRHKDYYNP